MTYINRKSAPSTGVGSGGGKTAKQAAKEAAAAASGPIGDALAIMGRWEAPPTTAKQLASEFSSRWNALDEPGPDSHLDRGVRERYLVVETVNRLVRDTGTDALDERCRTLDVVDKTSPLPVAMRRHIEIELQAKAQA